MGRSQETFSKKENEKKRKKKRLDKEEKKEERQANSSKGKGLEDMMAYIDENGNLSSTPPDPTKKKKEINTEDIQLGAQKHDPADDMPAVRSGVVTFFNEGKGYGFIKEAGSGDSIFVHINAVKTPMKENDKVTYEVERGPKGMNAVNVTVIK